MDSISIENVGIIGTGYVGLNLSLFLCEKGVNVVGHDVDSKKIEKLERGKAPESKGDIAKTLKNHLYDRLTFTNNIDELSESDLIFITVGTPLDEKYSPNLDNIEEASESIGPYLGENQVVIVKSTVVPGTTSDVVKPSLEEKSGLKAGEDFVLAFCPERLAEGGSMKDFEGSALEDLKNIPVIVGGVTDRDTQVVSRIWNGWGVDTVEVEGPKEAEMAKLADNLWIDLNIALANELALISEKEGIDAQNVISAANTLPKGQHMVNILYPGAGVGGYCLPKDPWFLHNLGKKYGLELKTPQVSRKINDSMPQHMVELVEESLDEANKELENSKIAVLGVSFKNSTGDMRNTPAKPFIEKLMKREATVSAFDPWVDNEEAEKILSVQPENDLKSTVKGADCITLLCAHPEFNDISLEEMAELASPKCVVIDGRSAFEEEKVKKAGFDYWRVGLGRNQN